jgi:hypothetical protein
VVAAECIVAKHLVDAYRPNFIQWHKILNRGYAQRRGRADWFREHSTQAGTDNCPQRYIWLCDLRRTRPAGQFNFILTKT